jgi:anti-anti-sigma factor
VPLLHVTLVPAPDRVVVRVTGDADLSTAALLSAALERAAALGTRHVVVDLAAVRFWDCSGLHALRELTTELRAADRSCRLVGAPRATRLLIRAAFLTEHLVLDGPLCELPTPNHVVQPTDWQVARAPELAGARA